MFETDYTDMIKGKITESVIQSVNKHFRRKMQISVFTLVLFGIKLKVVKFFNDLNNFYFP